MYTKYQGLIDTFNPSTGKELFALSETATKVDAKREPTFGEYIQQYIDKLKNHPVGLPSSNYSNYNTLLNKLKTEGNIINVPLSEIANKHFIQFGEFVLSTPNAKGQTNYAKVMTNFKAVHNIARDYELNNNELRHKHSKYAPTLIEKEPTALTVKQYQKFVNLDLSKIAQSGVKPEYYKELYRDFCIFMYEMKSRPVDCVRLHCDNLTTYKGKCHIKYVAEKKKNKRETTINVISPVAQAIIDKYKGKSSKGYIFPFAMNEKDWDYKDGAIWNRWNNRKAKEIEKVNHFLKKAAVELNVKELTLYAFRHSAFTHEIDRNEKSLLVIAKEGGTSPDMLGKHYYDY